ncbi:hypothetical protein, partial [Streptomyces kaempferi]|uniref:hypothetical protein n=1 Tax=Streptomyces kaempferi TaxID=333725 RepID=UPI00361AC3AB
MSDVEVRRAFGRLVMATPALADQPVEAQADAVVAGLGESLARAVRVLSGGQVDVDTVRRIDGELASELGAAFWRLDAERRAGEVADRLLEERALSGVRDIVEGQAAFARGQGPVRRVLERLRQEPGGVFSTGSV